MKFFQEKKEFRAFIPLLLELTSNPTESVLAQQRELIEQEPDFTQKTELLSFCMALATRHFNFEFLKKFFKEDATMFKEWEQVPYIGERIKSVLSEGHEKAIKEGIKEGM